MTDQNDETKKANIQADNKSVAVGSIAIGGSTGNINIHAGDIGYSVDEVSVLITQITTTFQPKPFDGRCPYKGLDVFEEEDAELFFGREKLVEDLIGRVKGSRTVFVTGPSGSGKSSLVRAGLIPALKQGRIKNSERWLYETMTPGRDPIGEVARVASGLASSTNAEDEIRAKAMADETIFARWCKIALKDSREKRAVILIDQFEEVFTQINKEERLAFLNILTHTATVENGRVIVLFSMRSDFVSNCATYPQLNALLNQQFIQIGSMQPEELVSAIAQPALRVGLRIDPDLVAQIINEMRGEPGALPLMQFALKDLFDSRQERGGIIALTLGDYLERGGIHKALERHADHAFARLSENEQELAHSIFGGLIQIGGSTQDTRRIAPFDELIPVGSNIADVQAVLQKLADARLITTDEKDSSKYTITHEKLIEAWPWLKKLVNENRDVFALQNEIANDAREWDDHKQDKSYLYTGARLANAREQLEARKLVLSELAQKFIEAGVKVHADELEAAKQRTAQLRQRSVYLSIALVFALIAVGAAILFGIQARQQATIARARELAAQSVALRENNFRLSLLLAVEAFHLQTNDIQTRGALRDAANTNPQLVQFLRGYTGRIETQAFSPNGKLLASGSSDGTIVLWDVQTQQPIGRPFIGHRGNVREIAFSPDSTMLASTSIDKTIILWDVASGQQIGEPFAGNKKQVSGIAFSPDGKTLASAGDQIILWDVASHRPIGPPLTGHTSYVYSVAFSPDGKTLASGGIDKTIILWDVASGQQIGEPLAGHRSEVSDIAFSPDGKTLASAGDQIILWDLNSPQLTAQPFIGQTSVPWSIAFSPDSKILASGNEDSTIRLWDVTSRQEIGQPLKVHTSVVVSIAFSSDGKTLASSSWDNVFILWDVTSRQQIGHLLTGHTDRISSVAFSPDGKTLASGSSDNTIILWDLISRRPIGPPLTGHTETIYSIGFSPDGKMLASGSGDGTIILWDVASHRPIGPPLTGHTETIYSIAFSPDGKMLASGSGDGTIILWDVASREPISPSLEHPDGVFSVAFSPDGKTLASGNTLGPQGSNYTIILWDVSSRQPIGQPIRYTSLIYSLAFSPDGKMLASASGDGDLTIMLWDIASAHPIGQRLIGHTGLMVVLYSVTFSPDGQTLASAGGNQLILWDVLSRQPIGQTMTKQTGFIENVAFSPDGKMLASGGDELLLWDLDPDLWIEQSCRRAGGNFTLVEWERYFPSENYRKTCEQWPLEMEPAALPGSTP